MCKIFGKVAPKVEKCVHFFNFSAFWVLRVNSALAHVLIGQGKTVLLMLVDAFVFGVPTLMGKMVWATISIISIIL